MGNISGYSTVEEGSEGVHVKLGLEHPGFADAEYRARRDAIAALSINHHDGESIPAVDYSDIEHHVWNVVSSELLPKHRAHACRAFNEATERLGLPTDHVPQLTEVSARLQPLTGFAYEPVAGLAPLRTFYGSFADKKFHSTQYLRHHSAPLYTPEPDIIHEVIGHANQLADPHFAAICEEVGKAVYRTNDEDALRFLSRVFWFTLEFGVLWEGGEARAYGAGIVSSFGEMDVFQKATIVPLDFKEMGLADYDITTYQPRLYAADSYDKLVDQLMDFYTHYDDDAYRRWVPAQAS